MEFVLIGLAVLVIAVIVFLIIRASKIRKAAEEAELAAKVAKDLAAEWVRKDRAKTAALVSPVRSSTRGGTKFDSGGTVKPTPARKSPPPRSSSRGYSSTTRNTSYDDGSLNGFVTGAVFASMFNDSSSNDTLSSSSSYDSGSSSSSYDSGSSSSSYDSGSSSSYDSGSSSSGGDSGSF